MAKLLQRLTEKYVKFLWKKSCEESFEALREALVEAPMLAYRDPNEEFILDTDCSGFGLCAVLSQIQDGQERFF